MLASFPASNVTFAGGFATVTTLTAPPAHACEGSEC